MLARARLHHIQLRLHEILLTHHGQGAGARARPCSPLTEPSRLTAVTA
jgi:hypothetical protein